MLKPFFHTKTEKQTEEYGRFVFEPLHASFANSMGNSLRRTLLSSLKGAVIGHVKVEGTPHLFSTIDGIKDSVLDIVLNLKQLRFQVNGDGPFKVTIQSKGVGKVTGADVKGEATVVNTDTYLAEITDANASLEIEAIVEVGYGYLPSEDKEQYETGYTAVDSAFSPVKQVNFRVEEARVGRKSNYERLILDLWTDGSISPRAAIEHAAKVLAGHFTHIHSGDDISEPQDTSTETTQNLEKGNQKVYDTIIDELNLPSRVINALLRENIETIDDLLKRGKENLVGLKGVGRKSIDLIEDELRKMGVELE
jgi:DNA-directed RNA polymerase subunit alpha